jgi:hypothetical protein
MTFDTKTDINITTFEPTYKITPLLETIIVTALQIFEVISDKLNVGRNSKKMKIYS